MGVQLKLPEVARRLGVSEKTARRYVKSGALPSMFVGNAYRVNEEDVERFLQDSKVTPGGDSGKAQRRSSLEEREAAGGRIVTASAALKGEGALKASGEVIRKIRQIADELDAGKDPVEGARELEEQVRKLRLVA